MHAIRLSGMERTPLESRAVRSAGYDPERHTLELEFATGRVYLFEGVPQSAYDWLLRTPSKGVFVSRLINGRYPYRDITHELSEPEAEPESNLEEALRASVEAVQQRGSASIRDYVPDDDDADDADEPHELDEAPRQESALERALKASLARRAQSDEPRTGITPAVVKLARSSALERVLRASVERRDRRVSVTQEPEREQVLVGVRRRPGEAADD